MTTRTYAQHVLREAVKAIADDDKPPMSTESYEAARAALVATVNDLTLGVTTERRMAFDGALSKLVNVVRAPAAETFEQHIAQAIATAMPLIDPPVPMTEAGHWYLQGRVLEGFRVFTAGRIQERLDAENALVVERLQR